MSERYPISPAGLQRLRAELSHLKKVERPKNLEDIERAREHGDLKENAEYHAAKERRMFLNAQLDRLEDMLTRVNVIDPGKLTGDRVVFGATVRILDLDTQEESTFQILSSFESDPEHGKLSVESPLVRALIGREEGDEVNVAGGDGRQARHLEILEVRFG